MNPVERIYNLPTELGIKEKDFDNIYDILKNEIGEEFMELYIRAINNIKSIDKYPIEDLIIFEKKYRTIRFLYKRSRL